MELVVCVPAKFWRLRRAREVQFAAAIKHELLVQDMPSHSHCVAEQFDRVLVKRATNSSKSSRQIH